MYMALWNRNIRPIPNWRKCAS